MGLYTNLERQSAKLGSNAVLGRWLDLFAKFSFEIVYRPGNEIIPADRLSRLVYSRTQTDKGGKPTPGASKEEDVRPEGGLKDEWETEDEDKTEFEEPQGESAHMLGEGVMQAGNQ